MIGSGDEKSVRDAGKFYQPGDKGHLERGDDDSIGEYGTSEFAVDDVLF